jgi:hypothetical protein
MGICRLCNCCNRIQDQAFRFDELYSEASNSGQSFSLCMENRVSKRGLPHAHILFWTDFDIQDIDTVDAMINPRYPKNSPFLMTKAWCPIFAN